MNGFIPDENAPWSPKGIWLINPDTQQRFFALSEDELMNSEQQRQDTLRPRTEPLPQVSRYDNAVAPPTQPVTQIQNQQRQVQDRGANHGQPVGFYDTRLDPGIQQFGATSSGGRRNRRQSNDHPNDNYDSQSNGSGYQDQNRVDDRRAPHHDDRGDNYPQQNQRREPRQRRGGPALQQVFSSLIPAFIAMFAFMGYLAIRLRLADVQTMVAQGVNSKQAKDLTKLFPKEQVSMFGIGNMPEGVHVLTGYFATAAFMILFGSIIYMLIRGQWIRAISYVGWLVVLASLVNLIVANDFLGMGDMIPPLLSLNPFDLFGYLQKA